MLFEIKDQVKVQKKNFFFNFFKKGRRNDGLTCHLGLDNR